MTDKELLELVKELEDIREREESIFDQIEEAIDEADEDELEESIDRLLGISMEKSADEILEDVGTEDSDMMHLTVPRIVVARNEISSKIQKGELIEIDIDGVVLMTEIDSIQEDDIGDQFGLQLEVLNDE